MRTANYLYLAMLALAFSTMDVQAQIAINKTGASADPSAVLDLSADDKGFIMPKLDYTQRMALTPSDGLMVYQIDAASGTTPGYYLYSSATSTWTNVTGGQPHRANYNMGAQFLLPGSFGLTATDFTYNEVGGIGVDMSGYPDYTANSVVLVTAEYLPNPSYPELPSDYCLNEHSGSCAGHYENNQIFVTKGDTTLAFWFSQGQFPAIQCLLAHSPGSYGHPCDNLNDDYEYFPLTGSIHGALNEFSDPYVQDGGGFSFKNVNAIQAGEDFEIYLSGNEAESPAATMSMSVFIDWNADGDFFDSVDGISELVVGTDVQQWPTPYFGSSFIYETDMFARTVPANAVTGPLSMRTVSSRFPFNNSPCIVDNFGSTRDYIFTVANGAAFDPPGETRTCNVYNQDASGFNIRCYDENGNPENTKIYLMVNPN